MKTWITIILIVTVTLAHGQTKKTPINHGILQSDLDAAGHKITLADLADYAGAGLSWNVSTNKFDAPGSTGPGGDNQQYQYNNAGLFGAIPTVTYDGTIPLTISKDGGAGVRFTGIKLVNPTNATVNGDNRLAPAIHLIETLKTGGVVHTYDHMIWGEGGSLMFGTSVDGGGYGGFGKAILGISQQGSIYPVDGDQSIQVAVIQALDWFETGGDVGHPPKVGIFNDSTPSVPGIGLANNGVIWWDSTGAWSLSEGDTKLTRSAAGVMKLKNALELTPVAVSALPAGSLGRIAVVNDGTAALAWGATVTGGGAVKYLVWYNGANWTVMGK